METLEGFEMPTPCIHCGEWFDLNDGYPSRKWHRNTTICETCHNDEMEEIDLLNELWTKELSNIRLGI